MPNNITRESLNYHQGIFDNLKNINPNALAANNEQYSQLKEIVNYIRNGASSVEGINESKFIFLVGPTGAGKSTLLNYLHLGDDAFVVANYKGEIKLKNPHESIANIGTGEGSTTVIPNMYKINGIDGMFLDCAGDGDTSGTIGDIINAMVRNKISQSAQQAKIALIAKQGSLDSSGGYGELFKRSLDQNAQFFKDVEFFKDSLGFVITSAFRNPNALIGIKNDLQKIADHPNFTKYKNLMKHILAKSEGNSLIVTFDKASEGVRENDPYSACIPLQHADIKDMIQNLPYSQLPYAGYFDIPRSPESSDAMSHILEAVVERGAYMIRRAIDEAPHPFSICSVEVNPFYEYISGLANGYQADYVKYCKILKYNNYLKINNLDSQAVKTIDADIKFVSNFVNDNNNIVNKDWSLSANIRNIFNSIKQDIVEFKTENADGNLFNSLANKGNIRISFAGDKSDEIKNAIDKVKDNYRDMDRLEGLRNDQTSEYYRDVQHSVFSHYEEVSRERTFDYTENEVYEVKPAYTTREDHGHWGGTPRFMGIVTGSKKWHPHWVTIKHPAEYGTRPVNKTRTVTEMVEEPVYNTITNRELDQEKYHNELAELQHKLAANVQDATAVMDGIPENHGNDLVREDIRHDIRPQVRDLLMRWQDAELSQYFSNNPENSLEVLGIEAIGDIVEAVDLI